MSSPGYDIAVATDIARSEGECYPECGDSCPSERCEVCWSDGLAVDAVLTCNDYTLCARCLAQHIENELPARAWPAFVAAVRGACPEEEGNTTTGVSP